MAQIWLSEYQRAFCINKPLVHIEEEVALFPNQNEKEIVRITDDDKFIEKKFYTLPEKEVVTEVTIEKPLKDTTKDKRIERDILNYGYGNVNPVLPSNYMKSYNVTVPKDQVMPLTEARVLNSKNYDAKLNYPKKKLKESLKEYQKAASILDKLTNRFQSEYSLQFLDWSKVKDRPASRVEEEVVLQKENYAPKNIIRPVEVTPVNVTSDLPVRTYESSLQNSPVFKPSTIKQSNSSSVQTSPVLAPSSPTILHSPARSSPSRVGFKDTVSVVPKGVPESNIFPTDEGTVLNTLNASTNPFQYSGDSLYPLAEKLVSPQQNNLHLGHSEKRHFPYKNDFLTLQLKELNKNLKLNEEKMLKELKNVKIENFRDDGFVGDRKGKIFKNRDREYNDLAKDILLRANKRLLY
ncbi:hypothetical protein HK099_006633 [Clydaea vesicula]|uniref:Uncharacterized protein n=1 Tax=Clydaea vesicula TaxID=447962 RepID=A0AAD5TZQ8_9FUNG|nr:hypothetical protein HK099_006633 [Clydaea vesicula]